MRDPSFRRALEYAVDRDTLLQQAYSGYAVPGCTFLPPDNWQDPDHHWAPDAASRRDFDPEQAE